MQITIDKDVPLPSGYVGAPNKYPFPEMEIGHSFAVPDDAQKRIRSAASIYGARNGLRFSIRTVEGGLRCWRVA